MKKLATGTFASSAQPTQVQLGQTPVLIFVWVVTLLVSSLPNIVSQEFQIFTTFPLLWARVGLLALCIALTYVWSAIKPLRAYFALFLVLFLADALSNWVASTPQWRAWFPGSNAAFNGDLFGSQLLRLGVAGVMIAALLLIRGSRLASFLAPGDLNATAEPVRLIGLDRPIGWVRFGLILSVCITGGTLAFLVLSGAPSGDFLGRVISLLPLVLILSALNAFSEEVTYRTALLAPLHGVVGKSQALLLTAALFGLWHFYGVPYGVVGVIMAGALGWLLGKSVLETKGLFWAWFIHFWQDVAIFAFITASAIVPGGA